MNIETDKIILFPISLSTLTELIENVVNRSFEIERALVPDKPKEEEFMTRKEAAKLLGISLVTLNEWSSNGTIPTYRISSRIRYKRSELIDSVKKIQIG